MSWKRAVVYGVLKGCSVILDPTLQVKSCLDKKQMYKQYHTLCGMPQLSQEGARKARHE